MFFTVVVAWASHLPRGRGWNYRMGPTFLCTVFKVLHPSSFPITFLVSTDAFPLSFQNTACLWLGWLLASSHTFDLSADLDKGTLWQMLLEQSGSCMKRQGQSNPQVSPSSMHTEFEKSILILNLESKSTKLIEEIIGQSSLWTWVK